MATVVDYQVIEDACYAAGLDPERAIYADYSGRAMYGATCLGIVYDAESELMEFAMALAENVGREEASEILRGQRGDSMGMSGIAYWPGTSVSGIPEED